MSQISIIGNLANLTTVAIEDQYGVAHDMSGCVLFGPINCINSDTNRFVFGVEVDQHFREAGWTLITKNGATGSMVASGMPDAHGVVNPRTGVTEYPNDAPLFEMVWLADNGGDVMRGFNPNKDYGPGIPGISFPWEILSPTWVAEGSDGLSTWLGIVNVVQGTSTGPSGSWAYTATFPVGDYGSLANDRAFSFSGYFGIASNAGGAGKTWESRELNGMRLRVHLSVGGGYLVYDGNLGIVVTVLVGGVPVGEPLLVPMMGQPDYIFMLDPYSFYVTSRASAYHGDLWQQTRYFCTMINTLPAMPQHTSLPPVPQTALSSGTDWNALSHSDDTWYVGTEVFNRVGIANNWTDVWSESGWCVAVVHGGMAPLVNNDGSDIMDGARLCFSTDYSGPGGYSGSHLGPMHYLGQLWNGLTLQRDYGSVLQQYWLEIPDPIPADEVTFPKRYNVLWRQSGPTEGSVLLAIADYDHLNKTYNVPPPDPDNAPISIKLQSEWNLFAKTISTEHGSATFHASGGRARDPDHAHYVPPQYTWTIGGLPLDWGTDFIGDTRETAHMSGPVTTAAIGRHAVSIKVVDTFGTTSTILYYLVIGPASYPQILNSSMPDGTVGVGYFVAMAGYGGSGTFDHWAVSGGALPAGLSLDPTTGFLAGTPTTSGVFHFNVVALDATTGEVTFPKS
jgi:hypothetical protein